jgi:cytochrome c
MALRRVGSSLSDGQYETELLRVPVTPARRADSAIRSASLPRQPSKVDPMNSQFVRKSLIASALFAAIAALSTPSFAVDEDAANALAKKNDCFKCHAVDKDKKGPSYKKIAAKYKGKPDGQEKVIKNITTGPKVKLDDGTEEDHKIINTKDMDAIKNLSDWILSR